MTTTQTVTLIVVVIVVLRHWPWRLSWPGERHCGAGSAQNMSERQRYRDFLDRVLAL
jgi:hypothetical protein